MVKLVSCVRWSIVSRRDFCVRAVLLCLFATPIGIAAQEVIEVKNVEYLQGVSGHQEKADGTLRISPRQIVFVRKGQDQFAIAGKEVNYVAARAQASIRARTADVGAAITSIAFGSILALLFHKAEKHLLSIEYFDGENRSRRLALFNVHDHSALAVKKMIDERLGLTADYYRNKDQQEEERKREMEAQMTPSGYWEATKNTMVGDIQYNRSLLEKGTYAVLIVEKEQYVGLSPEGVEWAKYRVPIREVKPAQSAGGTLVPVYKSSRLVGFKFDGRQYLFY